MKNILTDSVTNGTSEGEIARALENVRSDNSLLINQFGRDEEGFDSAWKKLEDGKIIKKMIDPKNKKQIFDFVKNKFTIAEYVWNLLVGFFVTSVSYNYMLNSACAKSPEEMKKRRKDYDEAEKKRIAASKKLSDSQPNYTATP
jgi:hypothetical protein